MAPGSVRRAGRTRRSRGSALVQALVAGLIAIIAALVLASRLLASRFGGLSRTETLTAREAAEYGLNEIQAQLNTDQYNHLWVTKFSNWGTVTKQQLSDCGVTALNSSGTIIDPTIPNGVTSARTIKSDSNDTITYQVTAFQPPALPDAKSQTALQSQYCDPSTTSYTNFGNLEGGSALITVTGTVTRGSGTSAKNTSVALTRRTHVASPGAQLAFSFMILGDAYKLNSTGETFGVSTDISLLNYDQGNICYAQPSTNLSSDTCSSPKTLPKTVIGCYNLGSCLINNVDNLTTKARSTYCQNVTAKKKKKKGFTCNDFQQATTLPNAPTPSSEGFTGYSSADWSTRSSSISCEIGNSGANDYGTCTTSAVGSSKAQSKQTTYFPYVRSSIPTLAQAKALKNSDLLNGCYFNNTSGGANETGATSTAINCLVSSLTIDKAGKNDPNLIVYTTNGTGSTTQLLPVNIFLHGTTPITLDKGGIQGSDTSKSGWIRLRIFGKEVATAAGNSVSCAQSSSITSKSGNDLNNLFVWLPNAALNYQRQASKDTAYVVIWACKFTGPTKDAKSNLYSIITPIPEELVRAGLVTNIGASFAKSAGSTFRGYGSEDSSN